MDTCDFDSVVITVVHVLFQRQNIVGNIYQSAYRTALLTIETVSTVHQSDFNNVHTFAYYGLFDKNY